MALISLFETNKIVRFYKFLAKNSDEEEHEMLQIVHQHFNG